MVNVNLEEFERRIRATKISAAELYQNTRKLLVEQQELLVTACEELFNALENLELAKEELHQQNENLNTAYEVAKVESQYYRDLFEYAPEAYLVTDIAGVIRQVNYTAAKLLNTQRHFLVGKPLVSLIDRKNRPSFRSLLNHLHQSNQVRETWEVNLLPLHSQPINVALTMNMIRNQQDTPIALSWLVRDIRKQKQAQTALRLLGLAIQANEPIVITSAKLDKPGPTIVFVNQAFTTLTGYAQEEIVGQSPRVLQGAKTNRSVLAQLRQNLLQKQLFHGELINYRKDGTEYLVELWCVPLENDNGEVTHFVSHQRYVKNQVASTHD